MHAHPSSRPQPLQWRTFHGTLNGHLAAKGGRLIPLEAPENQTCLAHVAKCGEVTWVASSVGFAGTNRS